MPEDVLWLLVLMMSMKRDPMVRTGLNQGSSGTGRRHPCELEFTGPEVWQCTGERP